VTRRDSGRLDDITAAMAAIQHHLSRGSFDDGLVFDAVRMRLIEIGEAVKAIDPGLLAHEPDISWDGVASMVDRLAHHDFDPSHAIVQATIDQDLPVLGAAVERLRRVSDEA
jgi:uncharacterized protein with HEPN domain